MPLARSELRPSHGPLQATSDAASDNMRPAFGGGQIGPPGRGVRAVREITDHGTFTFAKDAIGFAKLEDIFKEFSRAET